VIPPESGNPKMFVKVNIFIFLHIPAAILYSARLVSEERLLNGHKHTVDAVVVALLSFNYLIFICYFQN